MRIVFFFALLIAMCGSMAAQEIAGRALIDSDHDGLTDAEEMSLLQQFLPRFVISAEDCSTRPAEFRALLSRPEVEAEDGTIYGQAFPRGKQEIELHYYDLWRKDCGESGHALDAEHVSALLTHDKEGAWKARYWYAAAHEDTLCDDSQIARAKALNAEEHGAEVWISAGKHAAFLRGAMCRGGCGADACGDQQLAVARILNLGELKEPMNGATWAASSEWPLSEKMQRSDFGDTRTARLGQLPEDGIAWANPGKRPAQAAILGGGAAMGGVATGLQATDSALTTADAHSSDAMQRASNKTGNALARSYRGVVKALKAARGNRAEKGKGNKRSER
jgi:hypothetical protein